MTYVRQQTYTELVAHMRYLQSIPGWHDPLADSLFAALTKKKNEAADFLSDVNNAAKLLDEVLELFSEHMEKTDYGRALMSKIDQWAHGGKDEAEKKAIHFGDLDPAQRLALARGES